MKKVNQKNIYLTVIDKTNLIQGYENNIQFDVKLLNITHRNNETIQIHVEKM